MNFNDIFPEGLDFQAAYDLLEPLAIYIMGMSIYALFIFHFYRFVSSKDVFHFDLSEIKKSKFRGLRVLYSGVLYLAKYLFLFPFVAFVWFMAITVLLSFLAPNRPFADILLVAMAVVATIRVSSYITEELSRDLAKILPFAVLGIFIINVSFFKSSESFEVLKQADDNREAILYYLGFLIGLEFALRIASVLVRGARSLLNGGNKPPSSPTPPESESPESETLGR